MVSQRGEIKYQLTGEQNSSMDQIGLQSVDEAAINSLANERESRNRLDLINEENTVERILREAELEAHGK